ncbi:MAG TPA: ABC transporter substrate-binding protein [Chloroflexota bacterium]|nr:ABC transporter substrate-binding protein [Chloroflexota bacterium]
MAALTLGLCLAVALAACGVAAPAGGNPAPAGSAVAPAAGDGGSAGGASASGGGSASAGAAAPASPGGATDHLAAPLSPPQTVAVSTVHSLADAPTLIAAQRGYFDAEGLKVDVVPFGLTSQALSSLGTDQLQVVIGGVNGALYNQIARGIGVRIVADGGSMAPGYDWQGIAVRQDLLDSGRYKTPADLKGMKLNEASPAGVSHYYVDLLLQQHGLTADDVDLAELSYPDALAAFTTKGVDASALIEPFLSRAETVGAKVVLRSLDISPDIPGAAVLMAPGFIANREASVRFLVAWLRGVRDYLHAFADPAARAQMIQFLQSNEIDVDARTQVVTFDPNGLPPVRPFEAHLTYMEQTGVVTSPVTIDQVIDTSLIREAAQQLPPYQP